ncbi:MAG: hypothetical protein SV375_22245 [Thermodesulfobacteriota bacterium]|nr:hypothetical protein [Thermodesulfobacteriota bacterium]
MKTILKVFKYWETLEREFPSLDEAERFVERVYKKIPDLVFEPNKEIGDNCVIGVFDIEKEDKRSTDLLTDFNFPQFEKFYF